MPSPALLAPPLFPPPPPELCARSPEARVASFARAHGLSPRCAEILRLLGEGHSPKEVAACLGCQHASVRTHLRRMCNRLDCAGTPALVARLFRET
jgi:DNA-binding CsgD family transcriptional regulator